MIEYTNGTMPSDDDFSTIAASGRYPGMTTLTKNGRVIKAVGTGEHARQALVDHFNKGEKQ